MRVLLVEDEEGVARFIRQGMTEAGYAVDVATDGAEGAGFARAGSYDLLVVDIMLPEISGLDLLKEVRRGGNRTPVILLTARDGIEDKIAGLDAGADDYLVKPFAFPELLARARALLRRPPARETKVLRFEDLLMDLGKHEVRRDARTIDLSPREYALLEVLLRHPRQVLTRLQIMEHAWDFEFSSETNVIDVYVGYLRRKIDRGFTRKLIHTVRGVGYSLDSSGDS
ncbi:MAG TPA: response regulator transcription factor [Spirochaetia bacterium]|nr:response regulator transcription factor [Spirochaetia bacterium]